MFSYNDVIPKQYQQNINKISIERVIFVYTFSIEQPKRDLVAREVSYNKTVAVKSSSVLLNW